MEDTVEFHIYIDQLTVHDGSAHHQQLPLQQAEATLKDYINKFYEFLKPFTVDYIWQQDGLKFLPWTEGTTPHVWGRCRFGDNIDDEWFIVFLMQELTKQFNDISVRLFDDDGEFILIEAAYAIPKWLKPDTATNRVWLRHGTLYIIPIPTTPASLGVLPATIDTPKRAVSILCNREYYENILGEKLSAPAGAQAALAARITKLTTSLPAAQHHHVRLILPVRAALALRKFPFLVAPAVNAFYYRDLDDMKAFAKKELSGHGKPAGTTVVIESNLVETRVRFTRCLYAQLYHQQFNPSPIFPTVPPSSHPDHLAMSLGIKLTVGLQILYNRLKLKYEKEQKQEHSELQYASSNSIPQGNSQWELNFIQTIEDESTESPAPSSSSSWPPVSVPDDDDKWMFVEPQFIDQLLAEHAQPNMRENDEVTPLNPEAEQTLDDLARTVKQFVHNKSGHEGAEIRRDDDDSDFDISEDDDDLSDEDDEDHGNDNEEMDEMQFEPEKFLNLLQQVLRPTSTDKTSGSAPPKQGEGGMKSIMAAMDEELAGTSVRTTFVDQQPQPQSQSQQPQHVHSVSEAAASTTDNDALLQQQPPLDLDFEVVKHLLESVSQEHGMPGPASTLLNELFKGNRKK